MRKLRTYGSVRGAVSNDRPYCDRRVQALREIPKPGEVAMV
jgi:hypothetical protein